MAKTTKKSERCLNCGRQLTPDMNYCPGCGQENRTRKLPLGTLLREFLEDYFTFDSKLPRSIVPLLFKPGFLTNEFNAGHRVRYIPPLRLYLFVSVVFFFILSLDTGTDRDQTRNEDGGFATSITFGSDTLAVGMNERTREEDEDYATFTVNDDTLSIGSDEELKALIKRQGMDNFLDSLGVERGTLNRFFTRQALDIAATGTDAFIGRTFRNISIMMFFLMPVLALLLKLLYRKNGMYYIGHLIFSFHFHSFFFLFQSLYLLLAYFVDIPGEGLLIVLLTLAYGFIALRKVYGGKAWKCFVKFLLLFISYGLVIVLFVSATLLISMVLA